MEWNTSCHGFLYLLLYLSRIFFFPIFLTLVDLFLREFLEDPGMLLVYSIEFFLDGFLLMVFLRAEDLDKTVKYLENKKEQGLERFKEES